MILDAVWAYFVLLIMVMGIAALPLFRFIDNGADSARHYAVIDGLRGFAALSVFVFHLVITHRFIESGIWNIPDSRFYALLGPVGVSLFFMITGFLFWGKLLRAQGRPRWGSLYMSRLFRIGPMYLFVVLIMLYIVFSRTGFQLLEPVGNVIASVLQWLALGVLDTQPPVNGYEATHVLAGVTWTIAYEWAFYASLIATAFFARGRNHLMFVVGVLAVCLVAKVMLHVDAIGFIVLFLCGMGIASLLHKNIRLRLSNRLASTIALACLVIIFSLSRSGYSLFTALLLATFFYLVCSGATLFGLLTTTAARRLGNISYSLYLMQGIVLSTVFTSIPIQHFAMASALNYWLTGILSMVVLFLCAALGYTYIERPGIALGKHLILNRKVMASSPQQVVNSEPVA
jgi:peptidoglycan/LPS O-acetylase OafA/YrhL